MKLSDVSPLAGMLTGEGTMGKLMGKGLGGLFGTSIARDAQKVSEEEAKAAEAKAAEAAMANKVAEARAAQGMKKGGAVSASRRADGIAQRGKTRGKVL